MKGMLGISPALKIFQRRKQKILSRVIERERKEKHTGLSTVNAERNGGQ